MRRRVVEELGRSGRPGGHPAPAHGGGRRELAGAPGGRRAAGRLRRRRAAARARGRAARRRERGHAQRGHGDLRQDGRRPRRPRCCALLGDADEEVRNFAAVMLGARRERRRGAGRSSPPSPTPTSTCATPPRPAWARSATPDAVPPLIEVLRAEPWLQYPAIHALGEIGDPRAAAAAAGAARRRAAARRRCMEALGRLAGREALPRAAAAPLRPRSRRCATWPSTPWWPSSSAPPPAARASTPRCRPRCAARTSSTTCWPPCDDDDPPDRRTAAITLGWLKEPRAERAADRAAWPSPRCRSTRPTPSSPSASATARPTRAASDHPDDAVRQGTIRCLAWIAPPGGIDLVAPAHPRPLAGGAGRGRRPRSAAWATRTRPCCSSSCSATRAS